LSFTVCCYYLHSK